MQGIGIAGGSRANLTLPIREGLPTTHPRRSDRLQAQGWDYNGAHGWPSLLAQDSAPTKLLHRWALAAWAKCIALATRDWTARSRLRFCQPASRLTLL